MLVDRKDTIVVYRQLFEEGVFAIKDDVHTTYTFGKDENDQEITVGSLKVIKLLQSLWSRGYVKKTYSWCHFYYTLTDSGLQYLREFLHLPADCAPKTHKRVNPTLPREERHFNRDNRKQGERRFRNTRSGFDKAPKSA